MKCRGKESQKTATPKGLNMNLDKGAHDNNNIEPFQGSGLFALTPTGLATLIFNSPAVIYIESFQDSNV